jgi:outer membrane lipoprotein-sorting protein
VHAEVKTLCNLLRRLRLLPILLVIVPPQQLYPQTAQEIITKAEELLRGKSSKGTFEMTVVTPDFTRTLRMDSWWVEKTASVKDKSLIAIMSPKKEEGNKWLKIGNEMWNYLRATETTIKIPPSMMLQSWNGSDFSNDDLARESSLSKDYTPSLIGEENIGDEPCWKLLLVPKPEAAVVWGKLYVWVRKKDTLPALIQYFDEKGTLVRYMVYSDVKKMGGRTIPTTWTMFNKLKPGNHTEFKILDIAFDISIPDRIFSFRELERGN